MEFSANLHGPLKATAKLVTGTAWVDVSDARQDEYASLSIHVPTWAGAQAIADAINAAYAEQVAS